jgi:hypothetical protein
VLAIKIYSIKSKYLIVFDSLIFPHFEIRFFSIYKPVLFNPIIFGVVKSNKYYFFLENTMLIIYFQ